MSRNSTFEHAPGAVLDYGFDWSTWLESGETIVASIWTVPPALTISNPQNINGVTSVLVQGGVSGVIYEVKNSITTSKSKSDTRTLVISCKNR